ncbi:MAG: PIG-L family deacetylase [Nanoarchaeota archaeon]|nr:PIG-L family deacetylase [Nanoarchaeota archaeon]
MDEGYDIIKVVFSAGEKSHPHYKEDIITKERIRETEKISRKFGIKETIYFGLKDSILSKEINPEIKKQAGDLINKHDPEKIFIPCEKDPHQDHRAVHKAIIEVIDSISYKGEVYSYEVWNVVKEEKPVKYVDITDYFNKKIKMMKSFRSQWHFMYPLLIPAYFRARIYGAKISCKYAEKLYKLR